MYGPLILVNSALADSARIERGDRKDKKCGGGEMNMGEGQQGGTICYVE